MGIFHKLRCRLFGKKKKPIIYNYEEAARLDSLLLELRENRPRSTYDRHTYYINPSEISMSLSNSSKS